MTAAFVSRSILAPFLYSGRKCIIYLCIHIFINSLWTHGLSLSNTVLIVFTWNVNLIKNPAFAKIQFFNTYSTIPNTTFKFSTSLTLIASLVTSDCVGEWMKSKTSPICPPLWLSCIIWKLGTGSNLLLSHRADESQHVWHQSRESSSVCGQMESPQCVLSEGLWNERP